MTSQTIQFKPVNKDDLFYGKFEYSVSCYLAEATALRELNHAWIDTMIERRRAWREHTIQKWTNYKPNGKPVLTNVLARRAQQAEITDEDLANLHTLADQLLLATVEFKLVTSGSTVYVYSNDRDLIQQIGQLSFVDDVAYSQAVLARPKNTIQLKNAKHKYRTYFRSIKLDSNQKNNLKNFLKSQETVRMSPALDYFLTNGIYHRTMDHYFIDYNEEQLLTMLGLIHSGLIRKTHSIIPA